ncbi:hypothetical protein GBAR_LOCUS22749 [Geodia barretti]|uniref:Uncharacterized protein n=1 Tax=Geodia barretti TaxID=519541 RepID=A0AA35T364_GEOBA|nr:hypothetical protein GBAR_LOCUS22749 [Geodia barretti]
MKISRNIIQVCTLALCLLMIPDCLARPFTQQQQGHSRRERREFHPDITVDDSNRVEPCFKVKPETYANGTIEQWVNDCCEGFEGENCDVKPEQQGSGSGDSENKTDFDLADPCKNLQCLGVVGATCLTVSKCGERWPVFLLRDGTMAPCTNGQPRNLSDLTCSGGCVTDPCAGRTCPQFPDAFCVHTACECNEPMWLLDTGVQVDCETGEQLSPDEARERRRRRKRQAETKYGPVIDNTFLLLAPKSATQR